MERNLALEFVRVTEAAALSSARYMGRGDEKAADQAAVDAMRWAFNKINMSGRIVIGEGERDEAPMLYIGEKVGQRFEDSPEIDIALDPLEGTTLCAEGREGALSVVAAAEKGGFLHAPDTYMDKLACGPECKDAVSFHKSASQNIQAVSKVLKKPISNVTVVILDRPRHEALISEVRSTGARIRLITDGDVSAGIATCALENSIDLLMGIGGAPEGVLTAAALKCLGGGFWGKLKFRNKIEMERAKKMAISDLDKVYSVDDLAQGNVVFCATGVTHGSLLKGVRTQPKNRALTHSVVMRSETKTIRYIEANHDFNTKPIKV